MDLCFPVRFAAAVRLQGDAANCFRRSHDALVPQQGLHGPVAEEGLLLLPHRLHSRRPTRGHDLLLLRRRSGRVEAVSSEAHSLWQPPARTYCVVGGCSKKGKFVYSAVSSPQDRSKRFTLYFPDRPVHSDTISASLGSIQPYATINARKLLVHISTTVCSQVLIYTAE